MNFKVCKLTKDMADDYIDYFEHKAFSDGNIQKGCYCVWHHWTDKHEQERSLMPESERPYRKRDYAKELIENGILNGFAAVYDNEIVGFCNADAKDNYFRLSKETAPYSWNGVDERDKIFSIVCFTVAPDMRRRGIAKALLDYACQYAEKNGYDYIEGYPSQGEFSINDCGGSVSMYVNKGFDMIEIPNGLIARKKIKNKRFYYRENIIMEEWGKKVIEKALEYANYEWTATAKNIKHGIDSNGVEVDTPDTTWQGQVLDCGWWKPNQKNKGMAYGWGLDSTIKEFEKGISEGKYAGNVPEDKSRQVSYDCVGVDCSGLLTVCWELPKKISTGIIPDYANVIESIDEIRQGDVLAKVGSHVMFFKEFADDEKKEIIIIDATRSTGKVSVRKETTAELFSKGYKIYRKK